MEREAIKGSLRRVFKELEEVHPDDEENIQRFLQQVLDKQERLFSLDSSIKELLFSDTEINTEVIKKELDEQESFRDEVLKYKNRCEFLMENIKEMKVQVNKGEKKQKPVKNFNLPKLEIKKFDGNVKNWLNFWGQFKKINDDIEVPDEDKYQYLIQATEEGSPARCLVESFPPSAANYKLAIEQLKTRFARDEILVEVYVRELLNLVLSQQSSKDGSGNSVLSILYDKLETQLRALETLGVTSDKYAAMLLPLVESALPYELLKIWERNRVSTNKTFNNELQGLLEFLKTEVEAEERIKLAQSSFTNKNSAEQGNDRYTVETLHTESKVKGKQPAFSCIFCENNNSHASQDCIKAQTMPLEQKRSIIAKKKGCFACLKQYHTFRNCKTLVKCIKCTRKHYVVMCPDFHEEKKVVKKSETTENTLTTGISETLLQTINVRVISKNGSSKSIRALLDSGSQRSYVSTKCAEELGLTKIGEENIVQGMFGGIQGSPKIHRLFRADIENLDRTFSIGLSLLEQSKICNYIPKVNNATVIDQLKSKNIIINDTATNDFEIKLLIGADFFGQILTGNLVSINESLFAIETKFGWTIVGQQKSSDKVNTFVSTYLTDSCLSNLWNLDILGIKDSTERKCKEEVEIQTLEKFKKDTVINNENRYEVSLPWTEGYPAITSNYNLAEKRLFSTTKRLNSLNKFFDYDKVFQEWEQLGIIEEVEEDPLEENVHYLAHHAVIKESSTTTKIRPVFDASAKDDNGNSLNDLLEKGPNLIELIIPLILKFRLHKIGVTSDIAKAFLQISVKEKDRDYLRFLWWQNYEERKIKNFRHCRVVFGLKPSPFLLAATLNLHLEKEEQFKHTASQLKNSFYVDNCVFSVKNETDLNTFIEESTDILKRGNFDLRGWISNRTGTKDSPLNENIENKLISILGIQWNYQTDTLACEIKNLGTLNSIPRTKRGILSATQRVFDPIGFTAPFTLLPKLLLQETWCLKLNWDQKLPEEIKKRFEKWLDSVKYLKFCSIRRYLADSENEDKIINKTLHVFVDASKIAYGACIFIRLEFKNTVLIKLLLAKSRLCPVKSVTLPRLELMAALIGVRLTETVKEVEDFRNLKTYYWSDSMITLTWIQTKGLWNTFVGNRVKEIRKCTTVDQWRHVPGDINIADVLSRGCSGKQLIEKKWYEGPHWLKENEEIWPKEEVKVSEYEIKAETKKIVNTNLAENCEHFCSRLNCGKYSKIKRVTAWILRFYQNVKNKQRSRCIKASKQNKFDDLGSEELVKAEIFLIKFIQLKELKDNLKGLRKFEIFEDTNGILKVKTRLVYGDFPEEFKFPTILPNKNEIVKKLIFEEHERNCHAGPKILLGIIRQRFWLIKAKKTINSIIYSCVTCKKQSGKPAEAPFAPLPKNRINDAGVFEIIGVDLAGPLYLKENEKAWVVLFTCAVYRALHLELVKSLSTGAFLYALRRFISRRGRPKVIYSDNGTNFHGCNNFFAKLDWGEIENFSGQKRIRWIFNPPSAPWWGGWWERLVRVVKELLRRQLGRASLFYVELYTILCDIEAVVNSRPLTSNVSGADEWEVLTPASFLRPMYSSTDEVADLDSVDTRFLNGRFGLLQSIRGSLRKRFIREYLAELVNVGNRRSRELTVGEVVVVGADNEKRVTWPIGKIIEVYTSRDGAQRVARVKTCRGELVRPVQRLYPLELESSGSMQQANRATSTTASETAEEIKTATASETAEEVKTSRYGRILKQPQKFKG